MCRFLSEAVRRQNAAFSSLTKPKRSHFDHSCPLLEARACARVRAREKRPQGTGRAHLGVTRHRQNNPAGIQDRCQQHPRGRALRLKGGFSPLQLTPPLKLLKEAPSAENPKISFPGLVPSRRSPKRRGPPPDQEPAP